MKKFFKKISVLLILVLSLSTILSACGKSLDFNGRTLEEATVGKTYEQNIAVAGADGVTYAAAGTLPAGLTLSNAGVIGGIPSTKGESTFDVIASGNGYPEKTATFKLSVKSGAVKFENQTIEIIVNEQSAQKMTATDGVNIKYRVKSGSLPTGLNIEEDGTITGKASSLGSAKVTVTASATDCASADAEITINVINPRLMFEGSTLKNGRAKQFYGEQLPAATGAENVRYKLKDGSTLPAGLSLGENGYIQGTPTERATRVKFTVVATAEGFTSAEAEFTLTILAAQTVDDSGNIKYESKAIKTAYVGEKYNASGAVAGASADNYAAITYTLSADATLPEGFTITPNGDLRCDAGAKTAGVFKFKVTASAEKCASVTVEFTLEIAPAKLIFAGNRVDEAIVGTEYAADLAVATKPGSNGVGITYKVKDGNALPSGLTLSADGKLSGTPTKSVKNARFAVTANADGYTSADAYFYIRINEKIMTVSDGKFEAEYIDLDNFVGEGWSGTAFNEDVIQNQSPAASNGYYIGWTLRENTYAFNFNSSKAVSGVKLHIGLGTEFGNVTLTKDAFEIRVNGVSIDYGSITLSGISGTMSACLDYLVSENVQLNEGANKIELVIKDNKLLNGSRVFGPCIDYVQLQGFKNAVLTWQPCTYNLDKFF